MDNSNRYCPPFPPPHPPCPPLPDPTARFAAALAALTRLCEDIRAKVGGYDQDIAATKAAIEKEIVDRIAADEELRSAFVTLVETRISEEASERAKADEKLQREIEAIAGSEIGDLAEKLAAEIRNRIAGDNQEASKREELAASIDARFKDVISGYTEADVEILSRIALLKEVIGNEIKTRAKEFAALTAEDAKIRKEMAQAIETERKSRQDGDESLRESIGQAKSEGKIYTDSVAEILRGETTEGIAGVEVKVENLDEKVTGEISDLSVSVDRRVLSEKSERMANDQALERRIVELEQASPPPGTREAIEDLRGRMRDEERKSDELTNRADMAQLAIHTLGEKLDAECARSAAIDENHEARILKLEEGGGGGGGEVVFGEADSSSFYVWANGTTIPVGNVNEMSADLQNALKAVYGEKVLNVYIDKEIAPGFKHKILFRTRIGNAADLDIIVDWGDGTKTDLSKVVWDDTNFRKYQPYPDVDEWDYTITHTYSSAGKYLVKIAGQRYFNYRTVEDANLVCEVFTPKTHVAQFVKNMSSMYANSNRLLRIEAHYLYPLKEKSNMSAMFKNCKNLFEILSMSSPLSPSYSGGTFQGCSNLGLHDNLAVGPLEHDESLAYRFDGCTYLEADVEEVFTQKIAARKMEISGMFRNCQHIYGRVPAEFLWDDATVEWTMGYSEDAAGSNKNGPFYGCPNEIRRQVPLSWGGTNGNIVVRPHDSVLVTATDLSQMEAQAATKLAAVVSELKGFIGGLAARIEELEGGGGGAPKDRILLSCASNGLVYAVSVVNPSKGSDPTIDVSPSEGEAAEADELLFYGSDGKTYSLRLAIDPEGQATMDVERRVLTEGEKAITGIKMSCADDDALYVLRVFKPVDGDAVPALSPFGF